MEERTTTMKVPKIVTEFGHELVSQMGSDVLLGRVRAVSEVADQRAKATSDPRQKELNGELLAAINGMDEARRVRLNERLGMAAEGTIPEEFGLIQFITQDEMVEALTHLPRGESEGYGSWIPHLERLADMDSEEFWQAIDVMWPYKAIAGWRASAAAAAATIANAGAELAGITAGATTRAAEATSEALPKVDRSVATSIAQLRERGKRKGVLR